MGVPAFQTGHVGLNVTDLRRSLDFYRAVFDFDVIGESYEPGREYAFLGLDGTLLLTLWQQSDGKFDSRLPGLHHLSFQVPEIDAVRRAQSMLDRLGAVVHHGGIVPHGEGASSGGVFFEDPDGIRLEIYAPAGVTGVAPTTNVPTCGFF
ncbi:MAG TPA: VOC family protein [Micromonosporaceae bacterium]|nr:VOC family protein [Micromonosporaceae bacterium]